MLMQKLYLIDFDLDFFLVCYIFCLSYVILGDFIQYFIMKMGYFEIKFSV